MNNAKSVLLQLTISLIILIFGIWLFLYSPYGMGGLHFISPGAKLPDTIDSPSLVKYKEVFGEMGEEGRKFYLQNIRTIDTVFPFMYTFPLFVLANAALKKLIKKNILSLMIALIAFLPALFDLAENYYLHNLAQSFPYFEDEVLANALLFTELKAITRDIMFYIIMVFWFFYGIMFLRKYLKRNKSRNQK